MGGGGERDREERRGWRERLEGWRESKLDTVHACKGKERRWEVECYSVATVHQSLLMKYW